MVYDGLDFIIDGGKKEKKKGKKKTCYTFKCEQNVTDINANKMKVCKFVS